MRRRVTRILWIASGFLLAVLLIKVFVLDLYRIDSGSMRPTLFGGAAREEGPELFEWVIVRYDDDPDLERFDLVVARVAGSDRPVVKRVVGLPNESIFLTSGDLLIDGELLAPEEPRPAPIPVFDDRLQRIEDHFIYDEGPEAVWRREGSEWVLDGLDIPRRANRGMMLLRQELVDSYFDADGTPVAGRKEVNDAVLECEVRLDEGECVRLELSEERDTFTALIETVPDDVDRFQARVLHRNLSTAQNPIGNGPDREVFHSDLSFDRGRWYRLRFANIDNVVSLEVEPVDGGEGRFAASATYGRNQSHGLHDTQTRRKKHLAHRVHLGGEAARLRLRAVRIARDFFYTAQGEHAVEGELSLGPSECFLLGDNSRASRDSRFFGPVRTSDVLGRPVAVVWPPSRMRWLPRAADETR